MREVQDVRAEIDRDGCIGCGLCADTCPEVFQMDDENIAVAYADIVPETEERAKEAEAGCPVSVISIIG